MSHLFLFLAIIFAPFLIVNVLGPLSLTEPLLALCLVFLPFSLRNRRVRLQVVPMLSLWGFLTVFMMSILFSESMSLAVMPAAIIAFLFFLLITLLFEKRHLTRLFRIVVLLILVNSLLVLLLGSGMLSDSWLRGLAPGRFPEGAAVPIHFGPWSIEYRRSMGVFHTSGPFANWIVFANVLLLFDLSKRIQLFDRRRILSIVLLGLNSVAILMSASRNAIVVNSFATLVFLVISFRGRQLMIRFIALLLVASLLVVAASSLEQVNQLLLSRPVDERIDQLDAALQLIGTKTFLVGIGPLSFGEYYNSGQFSSDLLHNGYLRLLVETGLWALAFFVMFVGSHVWILGRSYRSANSIERGYLGALFVITVSQLPTFFFFGDYLISGFWIALGAGAAAVAVSGPDSFESEVDMRAALQKRSLQSGKVSGGLHAKRL